VAHKPRFAWWKGLSEGTFVQTILCPERQNLADDLPRWLESFDDPDLRQYLHECGTSASGGLVRADPYTGFRCELEQAGMKVQRCSAMALGKQAAWSWV